MTNAGGYFYLCSPYYFYNAHTYRIFINLINLSAWQPSSSQSQYKQNPTALLYYSLYIQTDYKYSPTGQFLAVADSEGYIQVYSRKDAKSYGKINEFRAYL